MFCKNTFNFGVKLIKKERECAIGIHVKGIQDRGRSQRINVAEKKPYQGYMYVYHLSLSSA